MNRRLRVLVTPRDVGPYQELLYGDFESLGVRVRYEEGPTPSQTLNILMSPAFLIWWRFRGYRVLHIHWVFQFSLPWARRANWARQIMQIWFGVYLQTAELLGFAIVWTAHDLLPHDQIFANDSRAQATLIKRAKVVIALSDATAEDLRVLGARSVKVIPIGPYENPYPKTMSKEEARESFDFRKDDLVVSLIGRMEYYKGADILLQAVAQLPRSSKIKVLVAGKCTDEAYRNELVRLATLVSERVVTRFEWIPDEELARHLQATDIAVFPFRAISNSGSVLLAQSFGVPVMIPNLPSLSDIPESSAIRFQPNIESLVKALIEFEGINLTEINAMSLSALDWATRRDWKSIAADTIEVLNAVVSTAT